MSLLDDSLAVREAIRQCGFDMYTELAAHPEAVYTSSQLEALLDHELVGLLFDLPNKTRAKLIKQAVATALGYPHPASMRRVRPRFPGQDLEVHTQQSTNLQIWNDQVSPTRRYAVRR